jgi:glycosyltransferase involved in cell wall biosynthesis
MAEGSARPVIHTLLLSLAALTLLIVLLNATRAGIGNRSIRHLRDIPVAPHPDMPRVSVVVAARNEERNIEEALQSLLRQVYPELEVIVVNDRSTDGTGAILDRMAAQHGAARHAGGPQLRIVHLTSLPTGWLGKNHALQRGAEQATGEVLLFTDADVVMEPSSVAHAVHYLVGERLDHLAVTPELVMPGPMLDLFGGTFAILFAQYAQPWKARDPRSKRHIGIGAFNMVRTHAYHAVGGHGTIRMRPDDDLKLGKIIKQHGFWQEMLFGYGMIRVEWYSSVGEAVRGLEKNSFAGVGYSVAAVVATTAALLLFNVWPFLAVFLTGGITQALNAATAILIVALYAGSTRVSGSSPFYGIGFPVATLLIIYILWRSMLYVLINGGIDWRGTHYSLAELRANRV